MTRWEITYPVPVAPICPLGAATPIGAQGWATFVVLPLPYVIVGVEPRLAEGADDALERARQWLARRAGLQATPTVPKLAAVAPHAQRGADLAYRTRKGAGQGWHPGVASSGLLALGLAIATVGSVPAQLVGGYGTVVRVWTPAGLRTIEFTVCPDRRPGVRVRLGAVHLEREEAFA